MLLIISMQDGINGENCIEPMQLFDYILWGKIV